MARIFITGSSDGLGLVTAKKLVAGGHSVVLHARNAQRARDAMEACPGAAAVLVGDLTSLEETRRLAASANALHDKEPFDAVVHNAGVMGRGAATVTVDGLPALFQVNTLAPYVLACLMARPRRLLFVSSGMHYGGRTRLFEGVGRDLPGTTSYADSKLHDVLLAKALARRFGAGTRCSAADPGWVPTKLGGWGAPEDINEGADTFVMAALGEGAAREAPNGAYFKRSSEVRPSERAGDERAQDELLRQLARISGVEVPE